MTLPLLLNGCLTGMIPMKDKCPAVPISPEEVVRDSLAVHGRGVSIVHIHARAPDQQPTWDPGIYREIFTELRRRAPDLVLCATTSGRLWPEREKRAAVLLLEQDARPDMASLTLGSLNFPKTVSANSIPDLEYLLDAMQANGVRPEFEVFDLGMVDFLRVVMARRKIDLPPYVNILLGNVGTAAADLANLRYLVGRLPPGAVWAACGIGRTQAQVIEWAIAEGGHVRVGLEDNIYLDHERKIPASNLQLLDQTLAVAQRYGRPPMPAHETRRLLGLRRWPASCAP